MRDDPRYYPYRYGGRNVVAERPAHPGPRFVFRDADPQRPAVTTGKPERRRGDDEEDAGRTSEDVGGPGSVPAPRRPPLRRHDQQEVTPERSPGRMLTDERRRSRPHEDQPDEPDEPEERIRRGREDRPARDAPHGMQPATAAAPRSTGEPELKRRRT